MRPRLSLLSILLLSASPAVAQSLLPCTAGVQCPRRYYWEVSPLTRAAPTGAAPTSGLVGSGMDLAGVEGARVGICAAAGQTLTGTGTLRAYLYDPAVADWFYNPDLDLSVSKATPSGARGCRVWPDAASTVRGSGRVLYVPDAIGVSGGTTVSVYLVGQVRL